MAGWGLCYRTAPHPAKGFASGLQRAFGASLLTLQKGKGKTVVGKQIPYATDAPAYSQEKRKNHPAGHPGIAVD